jgi:hypothetical protein
VVFHFTPLVIGRWTLPKDFGKWDLQHFRPS